MQAAYPPDDVFRKTEFVAIERSPGYFGPCTTDSAHRPLGARTWAHTQMGSRCQSWPEVRAASQGKRPLQVHYMESSSVSLILMTNKKVPVGAFFNKDLVNFSYFSPIVCQLTIQMDRVFKYHNIGVFWIRSPFHTCHKTLNFWIKIRTIV